MFSQRFRDLPRAAQARRESGDVPSLQRDSRACRSDGSDHNFPFYEQARLCSAVGPRELTHTAAPCRPRASAQLCNALVGRCLLDADGSFFRGARRLHALRWPALLYASTDWSRCQSRRQWGYKQHGETTSQVAASASIAGYNYNRSSKSADAGGGGGGGPGSGSNDSGGAAGADAGAAGGGGGCAASRSMSSARVRAAVEAPAATAGATGGGGGIAGAGAGAVTCAGACTGAGIGA